MAAKKSSNQKPRKSSGTVAPIDRPTSTPTETGTRRPSRTRRVASSLVSLISPSNLAAAIGAFGGLAGVGSAWFTYVQGNEARAAAGLDHIPLVSQFANDDVCFIRNDDTHMVRDVSFHHMYWTVDLDEKSVMIMPSEKFGSAAAHKDDLKPGEQWEGAIPLSLRRQLCPEAPELSPELGCQPDSEGHCVGLVECKTQFHRADGKRYERRLFSKVINLNGTCYFWPILFLPADQDDLVSAMAIVGDVETFDGRDPFDQPWQTGVTREVR